MLACAGRALLPRGQAPVPRHSLQQPRRARTARPTATGQRARGEERMFKKTYNSKPTTTLTSERNADCQSLLDAFYERKELWKDMSVLTLSFQCDNTLECMLALASPVLQDVMAKHPDMKSYKVSGSKETWAIILVRYYPIHAAKVPPLTPKQVLDILPVARHYGMSEVLGECKAATEDFRFTFSPTDALLPLYVEEADILAFLEASERLQEPWLAKIAFKHIVDIMYYSSLRDREENTAKAQLRARLEDPKDVQLHRHYKAALEGVLSSGWC